MIKNLTTQRKKAFTLAEALVTLVILGIIAALTIPGILINTEQHEYKSALKKALSVLNQVIELNIALEGYGPIETVSMDTPDEEDSLFMMFKNRMNVISTSNNYHWGNISNYALFTADGMRYEFPTDPKMKGCAKCKFAEKNRKCAIPEGNVQDDEGKVFNNPCLIVVDVNGQRRPNPRKTRGSYKVPGTGGRSKILDVFPIIVTDRNAYPFGVVAQRAMFQHD